MQNHNFSAPFLVRFNRSTFPADTLDEAKAIALDLIHADKPWEAKVLEVLDEDETFTRLVAAYGPTHAKSSAE